MANFANVTIFGLLLIILGMIVQILKLIKDIKSQVATNNIKLLNLINDIKGWVASNSDQPHPPASDPITLPKSGAEPFIESGEKTNIYEIIGPARVKLTLSNVHSTVKPYLLTFSGDEEKDRLNSLPIDGHFVLGPILGNIVFYDKDDPYHLITLFSDDVVLTFTIPSSYKDSLDLNRKKIFDAHIEMLLVNNADPNGIADSSNKQIRELEVYRDRDIYVPAYLYVPMAKGNIQIWKPFQSYAVEKLETGELSITITFKTWGDQNISLLSQKPEQIGYGPKT